jgi:hypothetical protein
MRRLPAILMLWSSIILSAQDKSSLPLPSSGNVTLPLDEYNRLAELANKPEKKTEKPPIPYSIKRANLKLRVASESVSGTVQCDGEIFIKGVHKIPLMSTPAVLDARQANKALPLVQEEGMHTAILSGPGEFSIMLDAGLPLNIESGRASFNLPVPMAGSVQLSLEIPGEHTNVKINPGLITGRSTDSGKTTVEATLVPGQPANIWWTTREIVAPAASREARFLSSVKTLVSISESDMRLAVLSNISVIQGELGQFEVEIPPGFEMTGVTGATLESEETQSGRLILKTNGPEKRNHQFLISLEKPVSAAKADVPFLSFTGAQRETGEILVEGEGTMELSATEGGTLKRMDLKEANSYLRSLARHSLHAAFRYHRQPSEPPSLALEWNRFPDSSVLAAAAELAEITTLVTFEGRSLTEVKLVVKNQAQPFLKVGLPKGAGIVTADVAGQTVKPVQGSDGMRVPLLRPGFRPSSLYEVSFVIMHEGTRFDKKGNSELILPQMDVPISVLKWEVFLPERFNVKDFEGDAIAGNLLPPGLMIPSIAGTPSSPVLVGEYALVSSRADEEYGRGMDLAARRAKVSGLGSSMLGSMMGGGGYGGFGGGMGGMGGGLGTGMGGGLGGLGAGMGGRVSGGSETIGNIGDMNNMGGWNRIGGGYGGGGFGGQNRSGQAEASPNVLNLQQRVAGVLPIHIDVPRTGKSYRFVRTLLLDEETKVTFRYKRK